MGLVLLIAKQLPGLDIFAAQTRFNPFSKNEPCLGSGSGLNSVDAELLPGC
ncbi:MAG: hypothetical protein K6T90_10710 [Leptolyngbyaceae cyanobacterium HOT.MB2.61]|nr:hypothetical protein [Leptolyngbyaceae cyanobacterium HOT.MB2.61]